MGSPPHFGMIPGTLGVMNTLHPELKRKLGILDDARVSCILEDRA